MRSRIFSRLTIFAAFLVAATCASAQAYGPPITLEQARKAMSGAEAEAKKNSWNMAIAIVDSGGHLVLFQRADATQFAGVNVAIDKAWSAAGFKRAGKDFQERLAKGGEEWRLLLLRGASPLDGGEPIIVDGKVIGAIGTSGRSAEQDGMVARAGVAALK